MEERENRGGKSSERAIRKQCKHFSGKLGRAGFIMIHNRRFYFKVYSLHTNHLTAMSVGNLILPAVVVYTVI